MKYFEKTLNFGLGLITYSAEKVEALVNELVKRGEVASEDAKSLANELIEKGETQREAIKTFIHEEFSKISNSMNANRKADFITKDEIRQMIREELDKQEKQDKQDNAE